MEQPVTILLPDEPGAAIIAAMPQVRALRYVDDKLPAGGEVGEVLVAGDRDPAGAIQLSKQLPQLRMVQTMNAGVERWLPHLPKEVLLSNARGAHGGASAEWAAAALLSMIRELPSFANAQAAHRWEFRSAGTLMGAQVLILGAGDLAKELSKRLEPFGAKVILLGRTARDGVRGVMELAELLPTQDAVVVMVPLNDRTNGMVDGAFLAQLRDGCIVVNVARGAVVDTAALLAELHSGRLRAALDVTDPEPLPADHPLWEAPGLLLTPHVAGFAPGRAERIWAVVDEQIRQYLSGRNPDNTVPR